MLISGLGKQWNKRPNSKSEKPQSKRKLYKTRMGFSSTWAASQHQACTNFNTSIAIIVIGVKGTLSL